MKAIVRGIVAAAMMTPATGAFAAPIFSAPGQVNGNSYAPGTVVIPQNQDATISFSINPDTGNLGSERILDNITAGTSDGWLIDIIDDRIRVIDGNFGAFFSNATVTSGITTAVQLVYSGSSGSPSLRLFENGLQTGSVAVAGFQNGTANTFRIGFDSDGGNVFTGSISNVVVATAAVPEPATWGMMILGMGAVGFAMRRRKVNTRVSYAA